MSWLAHSGREADLEVLCREHSGHALGLRKLHGEWLAFRSLLERAGLEKLVPDRSFAERLKEQYGSGVDPGVSLEERGESPGGTPKQDPASSELLRRLAKHTKESRYSLKGEIGRGGMGAILKVWDEDLRRNLAMKVILGKAEPGSTGETPPIDKRLLARFLEEAQVTGQLDHPGIVPVHELGLDSEGRVYFTMKLVKGRDLKTIFDLVHKEQEGWNETRALGVILKVCEAMAYAHAKGVIHRDLKPANVMVGNFGEVFVMDWGLARVLGHKDAHDLRLAPEARASTSLRTERAEERQEEPDSPLFTMDGDIVGTPAYMPLEQARGEIEKLSARADVYAIGALLYHLLARQMPYVPPGTRTTNRIVLTMVLQGSPARLHTIRKDIPPELAAICEKAMAREPEQRYANTLELAEDLRAYLERRVVRAYRTGALAELGKWVQRNKPLAASLAAAVLAIVAGTVAFGIKAEQATRAAERANDSARAEAAARHTADQNEVAARLASEEAAARTREARENLYVAAILGAASAGRSNEYTNLRRLLDSAPEELRNWEWGYLHAAFDASLYEIDGHGASFSPDGSRVVTICSDHTVRVWATLSGQELFRLPQDPHGVRVASFTPDGSRIVTASVDGTGHVWDASSGQELAQLQKQMGRLSFASFSPDGRRIVIASTTDKIALVRDTASGSELARMTGHTGEVWSALFSPDGARIVTTGQDKTARVWDSATGAELALLELPEIGETASFSPDTTRLVTVSLDFRAQVWDAASCHRVASLEGHEGRIWDASFSPDGRRVVTASDDHSARVWHAKSGMQIAKLEGHGQAVHAASFSPDGTRIVTGSGDGTARVWDAESGRELARMEGNDASFSVDGARIVTSSNSTTRMWDAASEKDIVFQAFGEHASFSPDGTRIVTAPFPELWDATLGKALAHLKGHTGNERSASFSPDSTRIVTASDDRTARVWDAASATPLARLEGHTDGVLSASFSSDGKRVVTSSRDHTARVWEPASGRELARLEGHTKEVTSALFSPDGAQILTGSWDGTTRVWDAASGKELARLETQTGVVSPGSSRKSRIEGLRILAGSAGRKILWDGALAHELAQLGVSPDLTRLVTVGVAARVCDLVSGKELLRLEAPTNNVVSASFSPDGTRVLTMEYGLHDSNVRVLDSVPYRARRAERQALLAAMPAGREALVRALAVTTDLVEAGARLRDAEGTLEPLVRQAALHQLLLEASAVRERAKGWLKELRELSPFRPDLEALVHADTSQPATVRAAALQQLDAMVDDASDLNGWAWPIIAPPASDEGRLRLALRAAERAVELEPEDSNIVNTLGIAQYRTGLFEKALLSLQRSEELRRADGMSRIAADVAFLAMALWRLGHVVEAKTELTALEELLGPDPDIESRAFLAEAKALIGPR